jgi:hypothetical protein
MGSLTACQEANVPLTRMVLRLVAYACGCILLLAFRPDTSAFAQGEVSVTAKVDKNVVSPDEQIKLTITIAGQFQQLDEPRLPPLNEFEIVSRSRSSQFSMVNGVVTSLTAFSYQLQPTGPSGSYTIEPIVIPVNGSPYHTAPIRIEISEGTAPYRDPEPPNGQTQSEATTSDNDALPAPDGLTGQDLFVEADVDSASPSVGQQIIYRFRFYQATNLHDQPRLEWPSFSGFWTESLKPNNIYEQDAAGRRYRVTEVRKALFPLDAGRATIEPTRLTIPGDPFTRATELESKTVDVDVRPLPNGAPDNFYGAVGQFDLKASVEPDQARVDEPVTLVVRVTGSGNLTLVPDPTAAIEIEVPEWRVYEPQITTNVAQDGDTIGGEKEFERLLVPRNVGELIIPAFHLAYFEPKSGEYRSVGTAPFAVRVAPGDSGAHPDPDSNSRQEIDAPDSDIHHIKVAPPSLITDHTLIIEQPVYWLVWTLPLLAMISVWVSKHRRQRRASDPAFARVRDAGPLARKRLTQASKLACDDEDAAYAAISRAVTDYLGDVLDRPSAGLTHDSIQHALSSRRAPAELVERTLLCLNLADSGRFGPAAGKDAHELIDYADSVIDELDETLPKR